ncbi:uncharacterized protein LOC114675912 isoform X2 [Macaca mulatta]
MPNVYVGPLFYRVHITRRKVAQMQHGVDVNLRKLHESERLLSQLPVSPFEGYRTLLSIDGGEWVPLPHCVILNIDRDVHTEAVQAAPDTKSRRWRCLCLPNAGPWSCRPPWTPTPLQVKI